MTEISFSWSTKGVSIKLVAARADALKELNRISGVNSSGPPAATVDQDPNQTDAARKALYQTVIKLEQEMIKREGQAAVPRQGWIFLGQVGPGRDKWLPRDKTISMAFDTTVSPPAPTMKEGDTLTILDGVSLRADPSDSCSRILAWTDHLGPSSKDKGAFIGTITGFVLAISGVILVLMGIGGATDWFVKMP